MRRRTRLILGLLAVASASCGGTSYTIARPLPVVGENDPVCEDDRCTRLHVAAREALEPACTIIDAGGSDVGTADCETSAFLPARLRLRVTMRCHEDVIIEPRAGEIRIDRRPVAPLRRYLRPGEPAVVMDDTAGRYLRIAHGVRVALPPNTQVDVLHRWPDEEGACTRALVRIADAGGATFMPPERFGPPGPARLAGRHAWVALDALMESPEGTLTAVESVQAQERARHEEAARIARSIADEEIRTGRCDDVRHAALEELLARDLSIARGMSEPNGVWDLIGHEFVVASDTPTQMIFRPTLGGEYHIIAVGAPPLALDVIDRDGASVRMQSPYERVFASTGTGASRLLVGRPREEFTVRVRGAGCVLLMAFARF